MIAYLTLQTQEPQDFPKRRIRTDSWTEKLRSMLQKLYTTLSSIHHESRINFRDVPKTWTLSIITYLRAQGSVFQKTNSAQPNMKHGIYLTSRIWLYLSIFKLHLIKHFFKSFGSTNMGSQVKQKHGRPGISKVGAPIHGAATMAPWLAWRFTTKSWVAWPWSPSCNTSCKPHQFVNTIHEFHQIHISLLTHTIHWRFELT